MAGCLRTHRFLSLFLVFDARRIPPRRARLHLGRILQRGLGTSYSHLALPPGKFHGQGARIVSRQAWTHRPSLLPFYFVMSHLHSSLAFALRKNRAFLINTSKRFRALIQKTKQDGIHCVAADEREINFALSQSAKKVHSCPTKNRKSPSIHLLQS